MWIPIPYGMWQTRLPMRLNSFPTDTNSFITDSATLLGKIEGAKRPVLTGWQQAPNP